ncbi:hypothetical protein [Maridesulfovibrio sp.]|uniref:hypothetical protein n=1 Tax=Maridesulfovibrio sp. TaxID=2795000 RepID=UPI003BACD671
MPVEQNNLQEIGVVTGVSGEAYAQTDSGTRALEPGSPIYQGEELVTGGNGNVEVRFVDDTLISQGANSRIALDDYVYDPDGGDSSFLGEIAEGTFRTVTGKIAEQNPDRFKLGSPLATIGIRGTIILSKVTTEGEKHGVEQLHAGKAMLLQSKATGQVQQLLSGQMSDVNKSGLLGPARPLSTQELKSFRDIAKANIRQEQEIQQQREDEEEQDDQNDEQNDEQQEEQQGEQGQEEQNDEQQGEQGEQQGDPPGELPGDVTPGGGDLLGPGGVLPGGEVDGGQQGQLLTQKEQEQTEDKDQKEEPEKKDEEPPKKEDDDKKHGGKEGDDGNDILDLLGNNDDTGDTGDSDDSGDSGSNPHDIHDSGYFEGTNDADTLTGSSSKDTVKGLGGNDTLYGESGDDKLFGGEGNDTLYGGAGEDMLNGGAGSNYLDGGGAADEVDFASFDGQEHGVTVDLNNKNDAGEVAVSTDGGHDVLVNIEGVIGTAHQDTLIGDDGVNRFEPGLNAEYVSGDTSTYETVSGGTGAELDWVQFEKLDSKYYIDANLASGEIEILDSTRSENKDVNNIQLERIENVLGSSGNDHIYGSSGENIIKGGAGNDSLSGIRGDDTIFGEAGNDSIDGGDDADSLSGGEGNDSISGGAGNDSIDGGSGADFIAAGSGADIIDGGEGVDSLSYNEFSSDNTMTVTMTGAGKGTAQINLLPDTDTFENIEKIIGTRTHDTFNGSNYADTFDGNQGSDNLYGHGGADVIEGGAGGDNIEGGDGNDLLSGGAGADTIHGDADNDSISGGSGDDTIYGGDGNDFIQGGAGNNHLYGGTESSSAMGQDTLTYAGSDNVTIDMQLGKAFHETSEDSYTDHFYHFSTFVGSDGGDVFTGASEDDTFVGGKGDDTFFGEDGINLFVGGEGTDKISFANADSPVTVKVADGTATHSSGHDTFSQVESFEGSGHGDTFYGSDNDETFSGGGGDDNVYAGTGNDTLIGGAGTNHLDGQGGTMDFVSFINASSGVDVTLSGSTEVTVSTGIGTDKIKNIEGIIGSIHDDILEGDGEANYFKPGLNSKYISDGIYETVRGGGGSDWIQFDDLSSQFYVVAEMNSNHVYIKDASNSDTTVNKVMLTSIENLLGTSGNDTITGSTVANTLNGAAGDDSISGGDGDDVLYGGTGNDNLAGGKGDNTLDGGEGYDRIEYSASTSGVTFNLNTSTSSVTHSDGTDDISNIEIFQGSDHDDIFNGSSSNETFIGGMGNDSIIGGEGLDTLDYRDKASPVTIITDTGDGTGTATRNPGTAETDTFKEIEHFIGSSCDDYFTGSDTSETFEGGEGTDSIDGGGGTDFISFAGLTGGSGVTIDLANNATGNTCTVSGAGNDNFINIEGVIGSQYADTITASSTGASTIHGGGGADTINLVADDETSTKLVYTSLSEGGDTVYNFQNYDNVSANSDKFCFSGSDFDSSAGFATYSSGAYTGNADAGTTDAYFVFDNDNQLWYDSNGDSAGGATLIASLSSGDPVTADDISFT